jgi:hypothetical protein
MANATVKSITLVYHGEPQQFTTVSQTVHFLRRDTIKTGWFHTIMADVDLVTAGDVWQTQRLRGQKFAMIKALEQLQHDTRRSSPALERLDSLSTGEP